MLIKLKFLLITISSSAILLAMLCLGSQNLKDRHPLKLGVATTAPFPTGFIVGISLIIGVITGGTTTALIINPPDE